MTSEASIWEPRTFLAVSADSKSVEERIVATSSQTVFTLTSFVYVPGTGALTVHSNGLLLAKGTDWNETSDSSFTLVTPATLNDEIVAQGLTAITGTVPLENTFDGPNPSLLNNDAALITGTADPTTKQHLEYGSSAIQSKLDTITASILSLNLLGGDVWIGPINALGSTFIFDDGDVLFRTSPNKIQLVKNDDVAGTSLSMEFQNKTGAVIGELGTLGDKDLTLQTTVTSADLKLTGKNAVVIDAVDFGVQLGYQGNTVANTIDAASGGLFVDNQLTGGGSERVLTTSDNFSQIGTEVTGAARDLAGGDIDKDTELSNAGLVTVTVDSSVGWVAGQVAYFWSSGAAGATFVQGGSITLVGTGGTIATNETAAIKYMGSDVFRFI